MEKLKVSFNQRAFELAMSNYKLYKQAVQDLNREAEILKVKVSLKELEASNNPFTLIASKHFDTLGVELPAINPVKYLEMTDIDTRGLSLASNKYLELKKFRKMPTKEDFTVYIKGEAQVKRWKKLEAVAETLNVWAKEGIVKNAIGIQRALGSEVIVKSDGKFSPQLQIR